MRNKRSLRILHFSEFYMHTNHQKMIFHFLAPFDLALEDIFVFICEAVNMPFACDWKQLKRTIYNWNSCSLLSFNFIFEIDFLRCLHCATAYIWSSIQSLYFKLLWAFSFDDNLNRKSETKEYFQTNDAVWYLYLHEFWMNLTSFNSIKRLIFLMEIVQKTIFRIALPPTIAKFCSIFTGMQTLRTRVSVTLTDVSRNRDSKSSSEIQNRSFAHSLCLFFASMNVPSGHTQYQFYN